MAQMRKAGFLSLVLYFAPALVSFLSFSERVDAQSFSDKPLDTKRVAPFDKDIRDDCLSLQVHCQSDLFAHVFLQCPMTCTKLLEEEGMIGTANTDDVPSDGLWDVGSLRTYHGKRISSDRWEGYVTVVSIVPLLPGMAVYFYEMMEHLHSVFQPNVEFVIIPVDVGEGIHIPLRKVSSLKTL